jgi:DNA repair exonuclease SbcCD ATPase subunit
MKRYAILLPALALMFGCQHKELENQIAALEAERQQMLAAVEHKDAALTEFMESLATVEDNLQQIRERELNIEITQKEEGASTQETEKQIVADIQAIDALLIENREKIQELNKKLAGAYGTNNKLRKSLTKLKDELTEQIKERETEIGTLKDQLVAMEMKIDTLNTNVAGLEKVNLAKDSVIEQRVTELHEAFFVAGTSKELQEKSVIDKKGGVLGLGRTTTLADRYDAKQFTKIDIREQLSFPLPSENIKLATSHPVDSYQIKTDEDSETAELVIANPEKFWESSKYLVMVVK